MSRRRHVAVVGGGFAGLAAAVRLGRQGARVTLLERRPFLGGRAYSFVDPATGDVIDNGPHAVMGAYTETLDFLDEIGAAGRIMFAPRLSVTLADPARGCARLAAPRVPGPMQAPAALLGYRLLPRVERLRLLLAAVRLSRRPIELLRQETVADALAAVGQGVAPRFCFWDPLVIATLNEVPEVAAAAPFVAVLRRGFLSGARAARFGLPAVPLSDLYVNAAVRTVEGNGGVVQTGTTVAELVLESGRVAGVILQGGRRVGADAVVLALPLGALLRLLPTTLRAVAPFRALSAVGTSPIVSVHCWVDRHVDWGSPFLGLLGGRAQWLFHLGASGAAACRIASVSSGARFWDGADDAAIVRDVLADAGAVLPALQEARLRRTLVVRERHATISLTPAADAVRPEGATPLPNLFLAGDWIQTGLPATIESAVISGRRAAERALAAPLAATRPAADALAGAAP